MEEELDDDATLYELGEEVFTQFQRILEHDDNGLLNEFDLDTEQQRFKLWGSNLGLLSSGHASLDYKLRNAPQLTLVLRRLLNDLSDSLKEIQKLIEKGLFVTDHGTETLQPSDAGLRSSSDGLFPAGNSGDIRLISDVESSTSLNPKHKSVTGQHNPILDLIREDDPNSEDEENENDNPSAIEILRIFLEEVIDANNKLFRLASEIRSSSVRSGPGDRKIIRADDSDDVEAHSLSQLAGLELRLIEVQIDNYINNFVKSEDRHLPENGIEREMLLAGLARFNVMRRLHFARWREEGQRRSTSLQSKLAKMNANPSKAEKSSHEPISEAKALPLVPKSHAPSLLSQSIAPTASSFNYEKFKAKKPLSSYTRVTRAPIASGPKGQRPPWPSTEDLPKPQQGFFECPYCFAICPEQYQSSDEAWRTHLVHDARPYSCTYLDCNSGETLFGSKGDWADHERLTHRAVWRCPGHHEETFSTEEEYISHVEMHHAQYKLELTSRDGLASAIATDTRQHNDRACPFCYLVLPEQKGMEAHLLFHLESVALLALPRATGLEQGETQSNTASQQLNFDMKSSHLSPDSLSKGDSSVEDDDNHDERAREPRSGAVKSILAQLQRLPDSSESSEHIEAWLTSTLNDRLDLSHLRLCTVTSRTSAYRLSESRIALLLQHLFPEVDYIEDFVIEMTRGNFRFRAPYSISKEIYHDLLHDRNLLTRKFIDANNELEPRDLEKTQISVETQYDLNVPLQELVKVSYWRKQTIEPASEGTLQWVLKPPSQSSTAFHRWISEGSGPFWFYGPPGSGKSTLMNVLSLHEPTLSLFAQQDFSVQAIRVSIFFGSENPRSASSLDDITLAIVAGIIAQHRQLMSFIYLGLQEQSASALLKECESHSYEILIRLLDIMPADCMVWLFLDALDKAVDAQVVLKLLQELANKPRLKIVVSSRQTPELASGMAAYASLGINDYTEQDIKLYIRQQIFDLVPDDMLLQDPGFQKDLDEMCGSLLARAQGSFLWAKIALRAFQKPLKASFTVRELQDQIDIIPSGLEPLYTYIAVREPSTDATKTVSEFIHSTLLVQYSAKLNCGFVPVVMMSDVLTWLDEGKGRVMVDAHYPIWTRNEFSLPGPERDESGNAAVQEIRKSVTSLININGKAFNTCLIFHHSTVPEFLQARFGEIYPDSLEWSLAESCIWLMLACIVYKRSNKDGRFDAIMPCRLDNKKLTTWMYSYSEFLETLDLTPNQESDRDNIRKAFYEDEEGPPNAASLTESGRPRRAAAPTFGEALEPENEDRNFDSDSAPPYSEPEHLDSSSSDGPIRKLPRARPSPVTRKTIEPPKTSRYGKERADRIAEVESLARRREQKEHEKEVRRIAQEERLRLAEDKEMAEEQKRRQYEEDRRSLHSQK